MRRKQKTKIRFVFESATAPQKKIYIRNAHSSIRKLNRLFPVAPPFIVAHIFRNRTSFLKAIHKKKAPDWLIAYVPPKSTSSIYVFCDKKKLIVKKMVNQMLLHEITHIYINTLNPNLPDWLKEGLSVYVAAQIFKPSISTTDWEKIAQENVPFKHIFWESAIKYNGYNIAGLLIMFFVKRYGWANFITAISYRRSMRFSIKSIPLYFGDKLKWLIADFKKQFVK